MKPYLIIMSIAALSLSSAVYAQEGDNRSQDIENPNNSSYPASNQLNFIPNEPDRVSGKSSTIYHLPSGESPISGTSSDPVNNNPYNASSSAPKQ